MLHKQKLGGLVDNFPKTMLKPLRISILLLGVVGASQTAVPAALDGFMSDMYTNTTAAGVFQTQQRGVISGGSFVGRFGIKSINLIAIDPPRLDAGCGGINLFGGSFSFINAQELTQLLRAIAQNALGLLFQLGLNAISQPLSSLLTTWSKKLQDMNAMLKNSCEVARKLFSIDKTGGAMLESLKSEMETVKKDAGTFADSFGGAKQRMIDGWNALKGNPPSGGTPPTTSDKGINELKNVGNLTWRAINATDSYKSIMPSSGGNALEAKILLMNVIGTDVFDPTKQPTSSGDNCSTGASTCDPKIVPYRSTLMMNDLISPQDNTPFYVCQSGDTADDGCAKLPLQEGAKMSNYFKGTAFMVNKIFYDINSSEYNLSKDTIIAQISAGKGIVGKAGKANITAGLTAEEIAFYSGMDSQLILYINRVNNQPEQVALISEYIRKIMISDMAVNLMESLERAAVITFNGATVKAAPPQGYDDNILKLRAEIKKYKMTEDQRVANFNQLNNMVGQIVVTLPNSPVPVSR